MTDSLSILKKVIPAANQSLLPQIDLHFKKYAPAFKVDTAKRISAFMAQAAHETAGFKVLREYASGAAYEGRKDLGNVFPGDGVRFRGRGIFQTTGRANYLAASKKIFGDDRLLRNPELLEQTEYAVLSALHYWNDRKLNQFADSGNFRELTRRINGGYNGYADRLKYYNGFNAVIAALNPAVFLTNFLKKKSSNDGGNIITGWFNRISFFVTGK